MTDLSTNDRRTDIINNLAIRLAVLEATHTALMSTGTNHAALIDKLSNQDQALVLSLNSISIKFDALIKQISIGIKIILACSSILAAIIGAFYGYSRDLDNRYAPKIDSVISNTANQRHKIDATTKTVNENAAKLDENSEKLNEQKEKIEGVEDAVTRIKKLKAVRGSR
jgi:uncharacterized coiled-coil protein SlyX